MLVIVYTCLPELFLTTQTFLMTGLPGVALPSRDSLLRAPPPPTAPPLPSLLAQSFLLLYFTSQPRSFSPSCKSSLPSLDRAQASPLGAFTAARASPAVPLTMHTVTTKLCFLGSHGPFAASSEGFVVAVFSTPRRTPGSPNGCVNERMNERRRHHGSVGLGVCIRCIFNATQSYLGELCQACSPSISFVPCQTGRSTATFLRGRARVLSFSLLTKAQQSGDFDDGR